MYWTRFVRRQDLEAGRTFVHGTSRLNLAPNDLATFVDPPDAALAFGFRALDATDAFDKSFPVWMATLRRRDGKDAIIESLQRVFPQLADEGSLVRLLLDAYEHARSLGFQRMWFAAGLFRDALLAPAMKQLVAATGHPIELVPTTGMVSIAIRPSRA